MSCLTRKLQQNLTRYLQQHNEIINGNKPEHVRVKLVTLGMCPSDVTTDQVSVIMQGALSYR
ncbi:MAG: hypothetical protein ACI88A_002271 [Paraglaciecola sp.]|jgi:hypothetical protein